ncbi:MAG: phosphoribosylamine--glycine ligase [Myxococcales bacterium]|nr:phosphoribosylamine--glycine ligase [Myxococcales bacterium]
MARKKVLVLGSGAREHALCRALSAEAEVTVMPGNAGIAAEAATLPGKADDLPAVVAAARASFAELVVVGPEAPLCAGVTDALVEAGFLVFGPSRAAAELEASKSFCKDFMKRHGIPTSDYAVFEDADAAEAHARAIGRPLVVKADGLAAGKGVVVASSVEETCAAIHAFMREGLFGAAGRKVVLEDKVTGQEVSFHAICDGARFVPLAAAQDHKRLEDGDRGPNTGGMGAYSPPPVVTPALEARILAEVIRPTVDGMAKEGRPFRGVLFAGLMIGERGELSVLEFNVRFGDPETAVLLARLDGALLPYLEGAARGDLGPLADRSPPVRNGPALAVVMAAAGYPESPRVGDAIEGLDAAAAVPAVSVLHAGTRREDGKFLTAGGRVLCITAHAADLDAAAEAAYTAVDRVRFAGSQHRRDIGARARTPQKSRATTP